MPTPPANRLNITSQGQVIMRKIKEGSLIKLAQDSLCGSWMTDDIKQQILPRATAVAIASWGECCADPPPPAGHRGPCPPI